MARLAEFGDNRGIEKVLYEGPIRDRICLHRTVEDTRLGTCYDLQMFRAIGEFRSLQIDDPDTLQAHLTGWNATIRKDARFC